MKINQPSVNHSTESNPLDPNAVEFSGSRILCSGCSGTGHQTCHMCTGVGGSYWGDTWDVCDTCTGAGQYACWTCHGVGYLDT